MPSQGRVHLPVRVVERIGVGRIDRGAVDVVDRRGGVVLAGLERIAERSAGRYHTAREKEFVDTLALRGDPVRVERSGDIDAGAVTFIMEKEGLNTTGVSNLLNKKSGVLGISGVSSDMRELLAACAAGNEKAILAEKMYYYRIKKYIGAYAAALGGVDIILFTGGVGENQMECRREVCKDMEFIGIELDNEVNAKVRGEEAIISTPASKVKVVVIPTDEELLIASDTMDILNK